MTVVQISPYCLYCVWSAWPDMLTDPVEDGGGWRQTDERCPTHGRLAPLSSDPGETPLSDTDLARKPCENCDDVQCMDCCTRTWHDDCRADCPQCCPEPAGVGTLMAFYPCNGGYHDFAAGPWAAICNHCEKVVALSVDPDQQGTSA